MVLHITAVHPTCSVRWLSCPLANGMSVCPLCWILSPGARVSGHVVQHCSISHSFDALFARNNHVFVLHWRLEALHSGRPSRSLTNVLHCDGKLACCRSVGGEHSNAWAHQATVSAQLSRLWLVTRAEKTSDARIISTGIRHHWHST